jgi:hypothetical protein
MKYFYSLSFLLLLQIGMLGQLVEDWSLNTTLFPNGARGTMQFDNDGNIIVVREKSFAGSINYDHAIQKYTPDGDLLWEMVNDNVFDEINFNVYDWTIDANNNIILVGDHITNNGSFHKSYAMKVSSSGTVLWQHPVTGVTSWSEGLESIAVTNDGTIYAYGMLFDPSVNTLGQSLVKINPDGTVENIEYLTDYYLQQLEAHSNRIYSASGWTLNEFDTSCNTIWSEEFETLQTESYYPAIGVTSLQKFHQNTFRMVSSYENELFHRYVMVRSYNLDGTEQWSESIDIYEPAPAPNEAIYPTDFTVNDQGETFIIGQYSGGGGGKGGSFGDSYAGVFVVALSDGGGVLWRSTLPLEEGDEMFPMTISFVDDQVLAVIYKRQLKTHKQLVVSFDRTAGNILWQDERTTASDFSGLRPSYAITSTNNEIYISGLGHEDGTEDQFIYLNKYHVDEETIHVVETSTVNAVELYPNPSQGIISLSSTSNIEEITVVALDGKVVKKLSGNFSLLQQLNIHDLSNGVYTVQVKCADTTSRIKLIKQ